MSMGMKRKVLAHVVGIAAMRASLPGILREAEKRASVDSGDRGSMGRRMSSPGTPDDDSPLRRADAA